MLNKKYEDKLKEVLKIYEDTHLNFYFNKSKNEVEKFIKEYTEKNDIDNNYDFIYFVKCIIKQSLGKYDSHTRFRKKERQMPFYFKFLGDGYYIVKCEKGYEEYLYSKLEKINGVNLGKLTEEIEKATCYSTNGCLIGEIERYLSNSNIFTLPSISNGNLTYELSKDNKKFNYNVNLNEKYKYSIYNDENYNLKMEKESIILTYNSCSDPDKMRETVNKIKKLVEENDISNFILDLRGNQGGNSHVIQPLIEYLEETNYNLVTLIDRYVFSSGRWAIEDMRRIGSKLIGEDIGTTINCFGENINQIITIDDDMEAIVQCATKYFGYGKDGKLTSIPKEELNKETINFVNVHPDIYVTETIEDLKNGKDVYLENALTYLNNNYMTKDKYKKLNDYLNRICLGLTIKDSFLLNNLYVLGRFSANIETILENVVPDQKQKNDCLSFLEIFEKAKEIINDINPEFTEDFDKIMSKGILDVNYNRLEIPFEKRYVGNAEFCPNIRNIKDYDPDKTSINMNESFNYDAVATLVHEYFHKSNFANNEIRYLLTEFISIYFELYSYEYLKKQGIDSNELSLNFRMYDLKQCAQFLGDESFLLYTFDTFGNYDKDTHKNIKYAKVSKMQLSRFLSDKLKEFEKIESNYNKENKDEYPDFDYYLTSKYNKDYRYFIGSLLAYYSLYNLTKEDVLRLNKALTTNEEMTFNEALKVLGFALNDEVKVELGVSLKRYIKDNNLDKKEEDVKIIK